MPRSMADDLPSAASTLSDNRSMQEPITRDPEVMHGTPVFSGTRVPVKTMFEYLEHGDSLDDFLEGFPTVSRELAVQVLEESKELRLARVVSVRALPFGTASVVRQLALGGFVGYIVAGISRPPSSAPWFRRCIQVAHPPSVRARLDPSQGSQHSPVLHSPY
jgi:uncharacterized protein (DUF433 family)